MLKGFAESHAVRFTELRLCRFILVNLVDFLQGSDGAPYISYYLGNTGYLFSNNAGYLLSKN